MTNILIIGQQADQDAKARTPRVTMPSNGGLKNPAFVFRRGSDIARTKYTSVGENVTKERFVAIVDRVVPINGKPFFAK